MTDEQIINALKYCGDRIAICDDCPYEGRNHCSLLAKQDIIERFNALKAENAALRERLEKAVEIPDYVFECINGKVERIFTEYLTVGELKNLEANGYSLTKEAAEALLAELKGEKE